MIKNKKAQPRLTGQLAVRLDPERYEKLEKMAEADRRKIGQLARLILEDFLDKATAA